MNTASLWQTHINLIGVEFPAWQDPPLARTTICSGIANGITECEECVCVYVYVCVGGGAEMCMVVGLWLAGCSWLGWVMWESAPLVPSQTQNPGRVQACHLGFYTPEHKAEQLQHRRCAQLQHVIREDTHTHKHRAISIHPDTTAASCVQPSRLYSTCMHDYIRTIPELLAPLHEDGQK